MLDSISGLIDCLTETDSRCSEGELSIKNDIESSLHEENEKRKEHCTVTDISQPIFSVALDRAAVPNRFEALLATTLFKGLHIQGIILDQHKIRRDRGKAKLKVLNSIKCNNFLKCISFDGKRERTLKQKFVNGEARNTRVMDIRNFTPEDGRGIAIAMRITNH